MGTATLAPKAQTNVNRAISFLREQDQLVLASSSPSKIAILRKFLPTIGTANPAVDESRLGQHEKAEELVSRLSLSKAQAVAVAFPHAVIIGADTVVSSNDGDVIGKPDDSGHAQRILKQLSGTSHHIVTGLTVLHAASGLFARTTSTTRVAFWNLSPEGIDDYIASNEPFGKAGAYAIQGAGALFVREVHGDYNNIMGMPLSGLLKAVDELVSLLEE